MITTETKFTPEVSRQQALDFLGNACRNWTLVPPLSNDDADDVAGALTSFLKSRGAPELYEAMEGIKHFSDALNYREDTLSVELRKWINAGAAALAKLGSPA